ncbi:hypothetical protein BH24ACT4_BH24ACT4_21790 [soil metagenome]
MPAALLSPVMDLPLVIIAMVTLAAAFLFKGRIDRAEEAEETALDAAGARSYLGFQVKPSPSWSPRLIPSRCAPPMALVA